MHTRIMITAAALGLAVSAANGQKIYWYDTARQVWPADLDGSNKETVPLDVGSRVFTFFDIAIDYVT